MHAGTQGTLAAVRSKYWSIDGKSSVRGIIRKCIVCFKAKPVNSIPMMGNLPYDRVNFKRPFF